MRIQEHLFQGFFGLKKKKDAGKYYSDRVEKLKGIDQDLDKGIIEFQKILSNHKKKLDAYYKFLQKLDRKSLNDLRSEIKLLEGIYDKDEVSAEKTEHYVLKIRNILKELIANEDSNDLGAMEKDVLEDVKSLYDLLESVGPLWERQLEFIKINDEEILNNKNNLKILSDIFREEGRIMSMEEQLLKKIDLKTGAILRRTTLKLRDLEETKDMNMNYREIKHIR